MRRERPDFDGGVARVDACRRRRGVVGVDGGVDVDGVIVRMAHPVTRDVIEADVLGRADPAAVAVAGGLDRDAVVCRGDLVAADVHRVPGGVVPTQPGVELSVDCGRCQAVVALVPVAGVVVVVVIVRQVVGLE